MTSCAPNWSLFATSRDHCLSTIDHSTTIKTPPQLIYGICVNFIGHIRPLLTYQTLSQTYLIVLLSNFSGKPNVPHWGIHRRLNSHSGAAGSLFITQDIEGKLLEAWSLEYIALCMYGTLMWNVIGKSSKWGCPEKPLFEMNTSAQTE